MKTRALFGKYNWKRTLTACLWLVMPIVWLAAVTGCQANSHPQKAAAAAKVFNVRDYGAVGNGTTLDTKGIQKALDACGKADGGTVLFPPGKYLSQRLTLRSRTTMQIEPGATLLAYTNQDEYLKRPGNWLDAKSSGDFMPFIEGKKLTDLTFTGGGTIDGNGAAWWGEAEKAREIKPGYTLPRPNLIALQRCTNVRLENITLQNSPKFHFVPADCDNVVVSNVTILAPPHAANTDAIDPSGHHILITHCKIDVGDDDVAIKAGKDTPPGQFESEDITITDCTILHGHGISIGSETFGGVRNVTVRHCTFENTENGLRIKSRRGRGGLVEDIRYSDITMTNVNPAITLNSYYMNSSAGDAVRPSAPKRDVAELLNSRTPVFRDIYISNLTATCQKGAGIINGLPESEISHVVLDHVRISAVKGLTIKYAKGIQLKDVQVTAKEGPPFILDHAQVEGLPPGAAK